MNTFFVRAKIIIFIMLLLATSLEGMAQKVSKVEFRPTKDHIPLDQRRNDYNNKACALVKVQVVDDIERVEGSKIGSIVDYGVEKWVYMCDDSRSMKIFLKNHLPVSVNFRDYNITSLESNRVYELVISTGKQTPFNPSNVKGNYLQIKVVPHNARFVIWSDNMTKRAEYPQSDGLLKVYLPYGRYQFWAEANGYVRKDSSIFVNDDNKVVNIVLPAVMGELNVRCTLAQADIFVNGVKLSKNKKGNLWSRKIPPGRYIIEARANGYVSQVKNVSVRAQEPTDVEFSLLTERQYKKKGMLVEDDMAKIKESVLNLRSERLAQIERQRKEAKAKADALARDNSYDIAYMVDGSTILCRVLGKRDKTILIKQKGNNNEMRIPIRDINYVKYSNGDFEGFQ